MGGTEPGSFTALLDGVKAGDQQALHTLMTLVTQELRAVTGNQLARAPGQETLHPTALVNEVYIRLFGQDHPGWDSRAHFFAAAATAMRDIIVDRARRRLALKRGGDRHRVTLEEQQITGDTSAQDLVALNEAIERLRGVDKLAADVVMLRYFAELTGDGAAAALGVSPATVDRHWSYAKAWLHRAMG